MLCGPCLRTHVRLHLSHRRPPPLPAGISHDQGRFKAAADRCLAEFSALFGGDTLRHRPVPADYGPGPDCRWWPLDCMYLSP